MIKITTSFFILLMLVTTAFSANAEMAMAILKAEVMEMRKEVLTKNMELTLEQAPLFWGIYDEFVQFQKPLLDESAQIISEYNNFYNDITTDKANELARRGFKNEKKFLALREKYYKKMSKQISIPIALRFSQIINRLDLKMRVNITNILPIIEVSDVRESN